MNIIRVPLILKKSSKMMQRWVKIKMINRRWVLAPIYNVYLLNIVNIIPQNSINPHYGYITVGKLDVMLPSTL